MTSDQIKKPVYYGIIADGIHTHPAALRIAYRANKDGLILVTDAISPLGLEDGDHRIGQMCIRIENKVARIAGTETLCGSIASMDECIRIFKKATGKYYFFPTYICFGIQFFNDTFCNMFQFQYPLQTVQLYLRLKQPLYIRLNVWASKMLKEL